MRSFLRIACEVILVRVLNPSLFFPKDLPLFLSHMDELGIYVAGRLSLCCSSALN